MERVFRRRPFVAALLVAAMAAEPVISRGQTSQPDQLRQELEAMKEQLRQVQQQMKKQEAIIQKQQAVIDKLAAGKPAVAAPGVPAPPPTSTAEAEEERIKRQVTEQIMRRIQPSLTAANKTFPSQFNPAIGLIIDTVGSYGTKARGNFEFRAGELGVSASVDPFARGYGYVEARLTRRYYSRPATAGNVEPQWPGNARAVGARLSFSSPDCGAVPEWKLQASEGKTP